MKGLGQAIAMVVVVLFITFTAMCWFLDVVIPGMLDTYYLFSFSGRILGLIALICSIGLWPARRKLSVAGLLSCLLWVIWATLPRL